MRLRSGQLSSSSSNSGSGRWRRTSEPSLAAAGRPHPLVPPLVRGFDLPGACCDLVPHTHGLQLQGGLPHALHAWVDGRCALLPGSHRRLLARRQHEPSRATLALSRPRRCTQRQRGSCCRNGGGVGDGLHRRCVCCDVMAAGLVRLRCAPDVPQVVAAANQQAWRVSLRAGRAGDRGVKAARVCAARIVLVLLHTTQDLQCSVYRRARSARPPPPTHLDFPKFSNASKRAAYMSVARSPLHQPHTITTITTATHHEHNQTKQDVALQRRAVP